jgi:hypothetical protein
LVADEASAAEATRQRHTVGSWLTAGLPPDAHAAAAAMRLTYPAEGVAAGGVDTSLDPVIKENAAPTAAISGAGGKGKQAAPVATAVAAARVPVSGGSDARAAVGGVGGAGVGGAARGGLKPLNSAKTIAGEGTVAGASAAGTAAGAGARGALRPVTTATKAAAGGTVAGAAWGGGAGAAARAAAGAGAAGVVKQATRRTGGSCKAAPAPGILARALVAWCKLKPVLKAKPLVSTLETTI